jgi:hypothetical protein
MGKYEMIVAARNTINNLTKRILKFFDHEPWWVEFWSGAAALMWFYISQLSGQKIYYHEIFSELSLVAGAHFWQACAVIIGISQISSLIYNDYRIRWLMCFFASWFWAFLTLAIVQTDTHPPGLALYVSYVCVNLVSMIKLSRTYA